MTATRASPALFVLIGVMLLVAGMLAGRSDGHAFGLSSDFLSGFLIAGSILVQMFGIAVSVRR